MFQTKYTIVVVCQVGRRVRERNAQRFRTENVTAAVRSSSLR
jgi:hypothetical protein